ncbi:MAG TPA: CsgG/HfaB family protein, partial [Smithellaceae bacterium]|nr:CsgG/HfaB family protein [Smithellaceae bacterium]
TSACAGPDKIKSDEPVTTEITATVTNTSGREVVIQAKTPEPPATAPDPIDEIARQVIKKSFLVEGLKVELDGRPAVVREIRGEQVSLLLEKPAAYVSRAQVKLKVPKKTIALVDFEVIQSRQKEAGRMTLESLTSALINSGHFIIVERSKLKAIMNELQLSLSGLTKQKPDQVIGNLFMADLLLTGTFAEVKGEWDINLRLVNVRSGQAAAAIALKTRLFQQTEMRDAGSFDEDFENALRDSSWMMKLGKGPGGSGKTSVFNTGIDRNEGAEGSKQAAYINFTFEKGPSQLFAVLENRKKRDLTIYSGVEFYIKATENLYGQFDILTSHPEDINKIDRWAGFFEMGTDWQRIRVPFDSLVVARGWIKAGAERQGAKPGDQVMRLARVESFRIGLDSRKNPVTSGKVWVDKIKFYND